MKNIFLGPKNFWIALIIVTLIASILSVLIVIFSYFSLLIFFIILAVYGGMSLPMYSLAIAHINDYLQKDEMVAASAAFGILVGIGSILGPILSSQFMNVIGPEGFFIYLFVVHILLGLFGLYRMGK